jgi:hypothetical protein
MAEIPLMPLWVTIFLTLWAPVGPLIGLLIGHFLSRSEQRRQWVADNEVKEWRELLTTLTTSFQTVVRTDKSIPAVPGEEIQRMTENLNARMLANEVLANRIFIAREVRKAELFNRWRKGLEEFDKDHDAIKIGTVFGELTVSILRGADKHIRKV